LFNFIALNIMMKRGLFIFLLLLTFSPVLAKHITGGEVVYDYKGAGTSPNTKRYEITLRLFRDNFCVGCAAMPPSVTVGIYNNDGNILFGNYRTISISSTAPLQIISSPPCLSNTPQFDYVAGYYIFEVELPDNSKGYTISYQTCCRIDGIANAGDQIGSTFIGEIPGNSTLPNIQNDNSARFVTGISIICANKPFRLDFSATDPDAADNLLYEFYGAYGGGGATINAPNPANYLTPAGQPYASISYTAPFTGSNPFGTTASINSSTGIISGIAPSSGKYIIAVNVKSYRNGVYITSHRKDFIVTVAPCDFASADISNPTVKYNCDSLNTTFANGNNSALITSYDWDFGDPITGPLNFSNLDLPAHQFSAPGTYIVKLTVNQNSPCASTDSVTVKVYPGFNPAVRPILPQCKNTLVQFKDLTTTSFPPLVYWKWDFGVPTTLDDTSRLQNPSYTYTTAGTYTVNFTVASAVGCNKTITQQVDIVDKPVFKITNDTLICAIDTLQLTSNVNTGTILWTPNTAINNVNSFNPLVSPDVTTTYNATYTELSGCFNTASVTVKVVNAVTLLAINDTTICRTDTAILNLNTDALYFNWTPTNVIVNPLVKNPTIFPTAASTTFNVRASISNKCFKDKSITVKTVPYPIPVVSTNAPICFGKDATLTVSGGSAYVWTPATYLSSSTSPNPTVIKPLISTNYKVTVSDTLGCPKPVSKTILVDVIKVIADAGPSDTSIVLDQPLLLQATGGTIYEWIPNNWLTNANISNPTANPLNNITYKVLVSNSLGCAGTDTINVKVFFLPPDVYVPSAFTPNKDGSNDNFKPIAIGLKSIENFSVFNRWGQLLFSTNKIGAGWDGTLKSVKQDGGTYVWTVAATDYKNNKINRKGTVILIR
jgi:gliding motility-associated-like protein